VSEDLDRLTRWEVAGGTWQVMARRSDRVSVVLCRCDGGEEVERFSSEEADLLRHIGDRETSEQPRRDLAD
jgi:hypothetical protein